MATLWLVGKEYVAKDGDVVHFRFNVEPRRSERLPMKNPRRRWLNDR